MVWAIFRDLKEAVREPFDVLRRGFKDWPFFSARLKDSDYHL
jgi:hypothetical protein